jgi:hypothetical protein
MNLLPSPAEPTLSTLAEPMIDALNILVNDVMGYRRLPYTARRPDGRVSEGGWNSLLMDIERANQVDL